MTDPNKTPEEKLQKLAERLRKGWALQYPVSEKTLETTRQAIKQQWEQEQQQRRQPAGEKPAAKAVKERQPRSQKQTKQTPPAPKAAKRTRQQSHDQDWGHSH